MRYSLHEGSPVLWNPIAHGSRCSWKRRALAEPKQEARDEKVREARGHPSQSRRASPDQCRYCQSTSRAESIPDPSTDDLEYEVWVCESGKYESNLRVREFQVASEDRGRRAHVVAIYVRKAIHRAEQEQHVRRCESLGEAQTVS